MGAWAEGPFENDTAADWLCGVADVLNFVVRSAVWSKWNEEGLAAAALLTQLPPRLVTLMRVPYEDLLDSIDEQLSDAKAWKNPDTRKRTLKLLQRQIQKLKSLAEAEAKREKKAFTKLKVKVLKMKK